MTIRNRIVSVLSFIMVSLLVMLQCYLLAFAFTGTLLSLFCTVASIFWSIPEILVQNYGKILLLVTFVPALIFYVYVRLETRHIDKLKKSED